MSTATLEFKKQVDQEILEPERMKDLPMAMDSYRWMFNASRRPAKPVDFLIKFSASNKHILVIRKNQFFKVLHEVDDKQLNTAELQHHFEQVYAIAERSPALGILTTENRDVWANTREVLLAAHPANAMALEDIEAASFVVCLDDAAPVTLEERVKQYLYGDGQNRWFDKPAQFIINDNGTAGFNGEHSMMDGTSTHRLNDYVCKVAFNDQLDISDRHGAVRSNLPDPTVIKFHFTEEVQAEIDRAQKDFNKVIGLHDLRVQAYQGYR